MSDGVIYVFVLILVEVCEKYDSLCKINIILRFFLFDGNLYIEKMI